MDTKNLSDYQLYCLVMNENLDNDLKNEINKEFSSRDISQDQIDQYDIQLRNETTKDKELSWITTILVVMFPFLILIQSIIATRHIENGKTGKWK